MSEPRIERVVIGLSGGVDSSVAAALLLKEGFEVIGAHILMRQNSPSSGVIESSSGSTGVEDARAVCKHLGIEFIVLNQVDEFNRFVIQPFVSEYRVGRTPNPCVLCNAHVKFTALLAAARQMRATHIATGHYARVEVESESKRYLLKRASDLRVDQSYFLFGLGQDELRTVLFPLGNLTKDQVRQIALEHHLPTAIKAKSLEICFVPGNDYGRFLLDTGLVQKHRGEIVTRTGRVLGYHDGIEFFTIGQRRGLRIAADRPLYVLRLDHLTNRVIVGYAEELECTEFRVTRCNWVAFSTPPPEFEAIVKIRYQHPGAHALVRVLSQTDVVVHLTEPQRAVTPGQACVFYRNDVVLGGGWII